MSKNNPEPANIQMTPVDFSPKKTGQDVGVILPGARPEVLYPVFFPLFIILMTLIYSTGRDIVTLNRQMVEIKQEIQPAKDALTATGGKQNEFIDALRVDLLKLGSTDPIAAQIVREYFRPPAAAKPAAPANGAKAPADASKPPAK